MKIYTLQQDIFVAYISANYANNIGLYLLNYAPQAAL